MQSLAQDVFENTGLDDERINNFLSLKAKELQIQLDGIYTKKDTTQIQLLLGMQKHSSVAIRRKSIKYLGELGTDLIIPQLQLWEENETDNESSLLLAASINKLIGIKTRSANTNSAKTLKVGEVITIIKNSIPNQTFKIEGEMAEPKTYSSMVYFGLKGQNETRIDCRILTHKLNTINFPLNEGLQIIAQGRFNFSKNSRLNFDVDSISLTGEGELARNLKILEEKLKAEGLFNPDKKREIKALPRKILLIASANSAAIHDFTKVLFERRHGGLDVYHLSIKTQGKFAEAEILEKLALANKYCDSLGIETIVVTRGGGSKDDLHVFNSEKVVRAIGGLVCPCIVAIGHEQDITLSELVADLRASTPSNAAQLVSQTSIEVIQNLAYLANSTLNSSKTRIQNCRNYRANVINGLIGLMSARISNYKEFFTKIYTISNNITSGLRVDLNNKIYTLNSQIRREITTNKQNLDKLHFNAKTMVKSQFLDTKHFFEKLSLNIDSVNPKIILKKGYSLVSQSNNDITSVKNIVVDKSFKLTFWDGEILIGDKK